MTDDHGEVECRLQTRFRKEVICTDGESYGKRDLDPGIDAECHVNVLEW